MRHRFAILVLALVAVFGVGGASAASGGAVFVPVVAASGVAPAPAGGVAFVADVDMPFDVLLGVAPSMAQDRAGTWYISVFRLGGATTTGAWVVKWRPGDAAAVPVARVGDWPIDPPVGGVSPQALYLSSARGLLARSFDGRELYFAGWEGSGRRPVLRISRVLDYVP